MGSIEANASAPYNLAELGISYTLKDQSLCGNCERTMLICRGHSDLCDVA